MRSLPPQDFASLPALAAPSGYICVIRDIDRDRYRIEATHWPKALIDELVGVAERSFGIELISVSETEDMVTSEAELYERHHARLSSDWLALDALQLEELRQSMLQIDAHASRYLVADAPSALRGATSQAAVPRFRPNSVSDASRRSNRRAGGEPDRRPLASRRYGARALDLGNRRRRSNGPGDVVRPTSARQAVNNWIDDRLTQNPMIVFGILVALAFICIGMIRDRAFLYRGKVQPVSVSIASPTAIPERQETRPASFGAPYLITQATTVYSCASTTCRRVDWLPERTQIFALGMINGSPVKGSVFWIEFRLDGEAAFVHLSFLEPLY